jgi:hypothetical protein
MLKDLVHFINVVLLILVPPLGVFGISVIFKSIFGDVYEIKDMDQEKNV